MGKTESTWASHHVFLFLFLKSWITQKNAMTVAWEISRHTVQGNIKKTWHNMTWYTVQDMPWNFLCTIFSTHYPRQYSVDSCFPWLYWIEKTFCLVFLFHVHEYCTFFSGKMNIARKSSSHIDLWLYQVTPVPLFVLLQTSDSAWISPFICAATVQW